MEFRLLKRIGTAFRISTIMSSVLQVLTEMDMQYASELERRGETIIPLSTTRLPFLFSKLTGEDILQIENSLDDIGFELGFGIDFIISEADFKIRVIAINPDDDRPPIDDDDDDPVQNIENADVIEAIAKPKAMSAHG